MTAFSINPVSSLSGVARRVVSVLGTGFALFTAAAAAANALENRRQPAEADLRVLGMAGVRFRHS